jgi:hypothetical protein
MAGIDPVTDSSDPAELRVLLARARERLSFYEGFDRVIAENVRRSGELMLESISMRDQVADRAALNDRRVREQAVASLAALEAGFDNLRVHLDSLAGHLADLHQSLDQDTAVDRQVDHGQPATHESSLAVSPDPVNVLPGDWDSPQVIEVIAHHVTKAASALALQRYLGSLDPVVGVEAREFAEGVLRLQVTARRPLERAELTAWTGGGAVTVLQQQPTVIELEIA